MSGSGPGWAQAAWLQLGDLGQAGKLGCGLAVVQERLFVTGGYDDHHQAFEASVMMWSGKLHHLSGALSKIKNDWPTSGADPQALAPAQSGVAANLDKQWVVCGDLQMDTAMHAHTALAVPLLLPSHQPEVSTLPN